MKPIGVGVDGIPAEATAVEMSTVRITGAGLPAAGSGASIEMSYGQVASTGRLLCYDRTAAARNDLRLDALNFYLYTGTGAQKLGISATGDATFTATIACGGQVETVPATYGGTLKVHGATQTTLAGVGGIELPVATDGYSVKIQAISSSGAVLAFARRYGSATWTESMRIDASGNVGIGVTGPTHLLEVAGTVQCTTIKATSAAGYISSDGSTGYTGTVTTASLVGKTLTIKDGIITGFA